MAHRPRRTWLPIGIALGLTLAMAGGIVSHRLLETSSRPVLSARGSSAAADHVVDTPRLPLVGVSSCLGSSCHGGPRENIVSWQNAYSVWAAEDPHAGAFDALATPRSHDIYRRLTGATLVVEQEYLAFLKDRCTSCHATFHGSPTVARLREGVGCESCHGPASDWLGQHTERATWSGGMGMRNTRDLRVRAELCVDCHIGPGRRGASGISPRAEVNHDLIAAGHPRLAFEFAAYLSRMPAHWDVDDDRKYSSRSQPNKLRSGDPASSRVERSWPFDLEAWWAGQLASARRALEQLEARAEAAGDPNRDAVWPEFSENDCFACHHQLGSPTFRQQQRFQLRPPGAVAWGDWHFSALTRMLGTMQPPRSQWRSTIEGLKNEMAKPVPDSLVVQRLSRAALDELDQVPEPQAVQRLFATAATKDLAHRRWEEMAAWYFSIVPLLGGPDSQPEPAHPGRRTAGELLSHVHEGAGISRWGACLGGARQPASLRSPDSEPGRRAQRDSAALRAAAASNPRELDAHSGTAANSRGARLPARGSIAGAGGADRYSALSDPGAVQLLSAFPPPTAAAGRGANLPGYVVSASRGGRGARRSSVRPPGVVQRADATSAHVGRGRVLPGTLRPSAGGVHQSAGLREPAGGGIVRPGAARAWQSACRPGSKPAISSAWAAS